MKCINVCMYVCMYWNNKMKGKKETTWLENSTAVQMSAVWLKKYFCHVCLVLFDKEHNQC